MGTTSVQRLRSTAMDSTDPVSVKSLGKLEIQSLLEKGVSHHHWHLSESQRQAEEWESFIVKDSGIGKNSGVPIGGVGKEKLKVG